MFSLISSAYAQAAGTATDSGGWQQQLISFAPIGLVLIVFWVLLFRPQQQKAKETRNMLAQMRRGDRVVTAGGIIATVTRVKDGSNEIEAEIAPNVRVAIVRDTISKVLTSVLETAR